jgi:hypothetical protein
MVKLGSSRVDPSRRAGDSAGSDPYKRLRPTRAAFIGTGSLGIALAISWATVDKGHSAPPPREVTAQEATLLQHAEKIIQRDCMARKGFRIWNTAENPLPENREFPYVIDDVAWARKHGYGSDMRRRVEELRRSDPNTRYLRRLSPQRRAAAITALNGDARLGTLEVRLPTGTVVGRSDSGCTAEAERALYGDLKTWFRAKQITTSLSSMGRMRVLNDPRFTAHVRLLAGCMRQHGYRYDDLGQARAAFLDPRTPKERAKEIQSAVTEANCANSTGLSRVADQLDREHKEAISKQYHLAYATRFRLQHNAVPRARSALKAQSEEIPQ